MKEAISAHRRQLREFMAYFAFPNFLGSPRGRGERDTLILRPFWLSKPPLSPSPLPSTSRSCSQGSISGLGALDNIFDRSRVSLGFECSNRLQDLYFVNCKRNHIFLCCLDVSTRTCKVLLFKRTWFFHWLFVGDQAYK